MKRTLCSLIVITVSALFSGCTSGKEEVPNNGSEYGDLHIAVSTSAEVDAQTRATIELPTAVIPDVDHFSLRITGTYNDEMGQPQSYDDSWETIPDFNSPKMRRGSYSASISYGNMEAEGVNAACFAGEKDFVILARQTITANITASLKNAAFKVSIGEWFKKYYTDARISIRTESNNSFTFTPTTQTILFVKPGTKLYMKGTAVKSQTGVNVEFPETEIGSTKAHTLHTIVIEASQAGSGKLIIDLNDTFTEIDEKIIELNPEA